jgi:hypothetical protein
VNYQYELGDSYLGSAGSTQAYLPLVYRSYNAYTSIIFAQNASSSTQDITARLYQVGVSTPAVTKVYSVAAGASQEIDLASSDFNAFGNTYGSAVLSGASGNIAVMVGYVRDPGVGATQIINGEYRGIDPSAAGRRLFAPLVFKNHNSWQSGITVQNTESVTTTVTVTYTASPNCPLYPLVVADSQSIGPDSSENFYLPANPNLPDGFFGGAELFSSAANVLAIANNVNYGAPTGYVGSCYETFGPSAATDHAAAPLVFRGYHGYETGINVQNAGSSSTDVTVTITKSPNSNPTGPGSPGPWTLTATGLGPGEAANFYLPAQMSGVSELFGSAVIASTGSVPIVAHVNSPQYSSGISTNYTAINY